MADSQHPAQPQIIQPSPVPMHVLYEVVRGEHDGKPVSFVKVTFISPTGAFVCFMDPEYAVGAGQDLSDKGREARSGLSIAKAILPPNGDIRELRRPPGR